VCEPAGRTGKVSFRLLQMNTPCVVDGVFIAPRRGNPAIGW
jgi:hypothetical protein